MSQVWIEIDEHQNNTYNGGFGSMYEDYTELSLSV